MFAAMVINPPPVTAKNKIKEFFKPAKPTSELIRLKNGAFFFKIDMPLRKGGINWSELETMSNAYADRLLLPCDLTPPPSVKIKRIKAAKLITPAVLNSCAILFEIKNCFFDEIAVIDKTGEAANKVKDLVKFCKLLCVITDNPNAYFNVSDEILDEYGAAILISDTPVLKGEHCAVIAPHGVFGYTLPANATVITGHNVTKVSQPKHLRCATLELEPDYLSLLPEGISQNDFACALYEYAAVRDEKNTRYKTMLNYGREVLLEQIFI